MGSVSWRAGLHIQQYKQKTLEEPRFHEGFRFYNTYGGHKDPALSPRVWCVLRDGLDAAETKRFPEAELAAYGAKQGDLKKGI